MKYNNPVNPVEENTVYGIIHTSIEPNSTVLEFGPAGGWTTKYLKKELNCKVYIVEINKEGYDTAIQYADGGILGDIESFSWIDAFKGISFDYIIFADVLEHLHDPYSVLRRSVELLKDNGEIILSVPNIANNNIILNLLDNKFPYTEMGILDNTHIKFFAYHQLLEMINKAGFFPVKLDAVRHDVGNCSWEFSTSYDNLPIDVAQYIANRDYADIYQFVAQIKKLGTDTVAPDKMISNSEYKLVFSCDAKILIDKGNGFNQVKKVPISKITRQIAMFDLTGISGIKHLRFEPISGIACKVTILSIEINTENNIFLKPINSDLDDGSTSRFYHKAPMYEILGDLDGIEQLVIKYDVEPLDWNEGHNLFIEKIKNLYEVHSEEIKNLNNEHRRVVEIMNQEHTYLLEQFSVTQAELQHYNDIIDRIRKMWIYRVAKKLHLIPKSLTK